MARDRCLREDCWYYDDIKYKPIPGKKLGIMPNHKCVTTEFLKDLKEKFGFSLLFSNETEWLEKAYVAGWEKNRIMLGTSGSLGNMQFAEELWLNFVKKSEKIKWQKANCGPIPPPDCLPPGYPDWPPFIDHIKSLIPPFYSIYIDEPWKYPLLGTKGIVKSLDEPYIPANPDQRLREILVDFGYNYPELSSKEIFCKIADLKSIWSSITINNYDYAGRQLETSKWYADRFWLVSYFIHECINTKFTVSAYNSPYNNWWRDLADIDNKSYNVPGSHWNNWIDQLFDDGYYYYDWKQFVDTISIARGAWISSLDLDTPKDIQEKFSYAKTANLSELWFFPGQSDVIDNWSCEEWIVRLRNFIEYAVKNQYLEVGAVVRKRKCESYYIPGCREDEMYVPDTAFDPFLNKTPFFP